jgi:hypothetical protein
LQKTNKLLVVDEDLPGGGISLHPAKNNGRSKWLLRRMALMAIILPSHLSMILSKPFMG